MKISIISHNLSGNCVGRAFILAQMLEKYYDVEIIGPTYGKQIWPPVQNEYEYKVTNKGLFLENVKKIVEVISGDIIYAVKPRVMSFGSGLIKRKHEKIPLILDIDDWDLGFYSYQGIKQITYFLLSHKQPENHFISNFLMEKLSKYADSITVSNRYLKDKFGGMIIPHARNLNLMDPKKYNAEKLKSKYEVHGKKIVLFLGTPRPFKGVEDLINALILLENKEIILCIVGLDYNDRYCQEIIQLSKKKLGYNNIKLFGFQPFHKIPEFFSFADIVAIPQRKNLATIGQLPAKLFDAMAMEKAIISTDVSDIPEILDGCGLVAKAGDINDIAKKINFFLENENIAIKLGKAARIKCLKYYSYESVGKKLYNIFNKYEK